MTYTKQLLVFIGILATLSFADNRNSPQKVDASLKHKPSIVKIEKIGRRFELTRNGQPYFINGAGGRNHLDMLVEAGGNSIRTWSSSQRKCSRNNETGFTIKS
ncbi:MAG: hypothetical protein ACYSOX_03020 [Planctomycetota bacterium]|jgi:hypothetical protein